MRNLCPALGNSERFHSEPAGGPVFMDFTEKHGPLLAQMIKACLLMLLPAQCPYRFTCHPGVSSVFPTLRDLPLHVVFGVFDSSW